MSKNNNPSGDNNDSGGLALLIGGAIGLGLLYLLGKGQTQPQQPMIYRCPECRNQIQKGVLVCPYCYTGLKWA